jgi:hypothetical protein
VLTFFVISFIIKIVKEDTYRKEGIVMKGSYELETVADMIRYGTEYETVYDYVDNLYEGNEIANAVYKKMIDMIVENY